MNTAPCRFVLRDPAARGALVEDLVKSLGKFKVPEREKAELLGILGPMKSSIVGQ